MREKGRIANVSSNFKKRRGGSKSVNAVNNVMKLKFSLVQDLWGQIVRDNIALSVILLILKPVFIGKSPRKNMI